MVTRTSYPPLAKSPGVSHPKLAEESKWDKLRRGASEVVEKVRPAGKRVKEWMEAHPHNRRERSERSEPRERREAPRRRTPTRVDKYQDGKVTETIYFGTDEKLPRRQAPKKTAKPRLRDPLGGMGSGLNMRDFLPSTMGLGESMGYNQPRGKKKKKSGGSWMDPGYIPPELRDFF